MYEKFMTLREVCTHVGTTRSAVQGYEKMGLVHASKVNKYGHLLYDEGAVNRIAIIFFMQKLEFSLKEIKELLALSERDFLNAVCARIVQLKEKTQRYENFLYLSEEIIFSADDRHIENKIIELLNKGDLK